MQVLAQPDDLVLYVDGGCNNSGNKIGAYYYMCIKLGHAPLHADYKHGTVIFGGGAKEEKTTNNIMEMTAVLKGLLRCKQGQVIPKFVVTDSEYVQKGLTLWSNNWRRNGWKGSTGLPISNVVLWKELLKIWNKEQTTVVHVRGHCGVFWNEFCDRRASELMKGAQPVPNDLERVAYDFDGSL